MRERERERKGTRRRSWGEEGEDTSLLAALRRSPRNRGASSANRSSRKTRLARGGNRGGFAWRKSRQPSRQAPSGSNLNLSLRPPPTLQPSNAFAFPTAFVCSSPHSLLFCTASSALPVCFVSFFYIYFDNIHRHVAWLGFIRTAAIFV